MRGESREGAEPSTFEDSAARPAAATLDRGGRSSATEAGAERRPVVAVFMGTSLTAGLGLLRDEDRFTDQIQELADSAGLPVEVVNAGVSGDTSAGGLARLDWVLRDSLDVLVVELGANDGLRGLDPDALESNLREIVSRTRERYPGVKIVLAGMEAPPNLGVRYTERFRSVYTRVAGDMGLTLVPFLLEGVAGVTELNQSDRMHPNREGHRRIARDVVWPVLKPVLEDVLASRNAGRRP